ncbi:uncharacterized protein LOC135832948 [Planococcus citri]|uniref:uncharacterized protein LOC135832948 n=1 Tax=Planococcus citri TaxID=170843 RepID=UPI0031F84BB4
MAESENSTKVYDRVYPSPPSLKQISSVAIAANLWRKIINDNANRSSNTSSGLKMILGSSVKNMLPDLPSTIYPNIVRSFSNIQFSLFTGWFTNVSDKFNEIVCDFDGFIDYDKLAKRAVLCERISDLEKFKIACRYCLIDDAMRIWPSISEQLNLSDINFENDPVVYYWLCHFRNQLDAIPLVDHNLATIDEHLIEILNPKNWSAVEYFWNHLKPESRIENAKYLLENNQYLFSKYILVRLKDEELNRLMVETDLMKFLLNGEYRIEGCQNMDLGGPCFLAAWNYVKHKISVQSFIQLVQEILKQQNGNAYYISNDSDNPSFSYELWSSAPQQLRNSIIRDESLIRSFFLENKLGRLLWCILSEIPLKTRNTLWHENWRAVLPYKKSKDLQKFMNLCFNSKSDIILFKKNNLSEFEYIKLNCFEYMKELRFQELNEFLTFCCVEEQNFPDLHVKLLNGLLNYFFNMSSVGLSKAVNFISKIHPLNTFIDEAFNDVDLAADFKNRFLFTSRTIEILARCLAASIELEKVMEFVDLFAISKQTAKDFKERHFLPAFVNLLTIGFDLDFKFERERFENFMRWCLGITGITNYKITNFKSTMPVRDIVRSIIEDEEAKIFGRILEDDYEEKHMGELYCNLGKFLEWYFNSPKKAAKFKKQFIGFEKYCIQ